MLARCVYSGGGEDTLQRNFNDSWSLNGPLLVVTHIILAQLCKSCFGIIAVKCDFSEFQQLVKFFFFFYIVIICNNNNIYIT